MDSNAIRETSPLPVNFRDWKRVLKSKRTINDHFEDVASSLLSSDNAEGYRTYLDAIYNEQAVEGSTIADDFQAAEMVRDHAKDLGNKDVASANLTVLRKAQNVFLHRYNYSREQRREAKGGIQIVPENNGD